MQFNVAQREVTIKVVYYGPPFSGKTTNLQAVHRLLAPGVCGELTILNTADDRTLFFDLLPIVVNSRSGYRIKLKLFTVPGQVIHAATRRVVLTGADGVIFVADSRVAEARRNNDFWHGMRHYLVETGTDPKQVPMVIQFNKRDLPNTRSDDDLERLRRVSEQPLYTAVAVRGIGVLETLRGLMETLFRHLDERHRFQEKLQISADEFLGAIFGAVDRGPADPTPAQGAGGSR